MARSEKKKAFLPRFLGQCGILLLGGYLVMCVLFNHMQIVEKQQELQSVEKQLTIQKQKNDELARILESGNELEIIERVARDKMGYAKPNERVFVDVTGQ